MHPLNLKPQAAMREGGTDALLPRWPFDLFVPGRKTRMTFTWLTCLFLFRSTAEPSTLILLSRWVPTETKVESGTSQSKRGTAVHLTVENTNQVATRNRRARCQGAGCRVQGSGFRVQGSGFRVQGSGARNRRAPSARVVRHLPLPRKALRTLNQKSFLEDFVNF